MKKDFIFSGLLIVVNIALFLLRYTGMPVHIALAFVGVALLAVYTIISRKTWKLPAVEIIMRAFYAVALVSGVVLTKVNGVAPLAIIHKLTGALFVVSLVFLLIHKALKKN